MIKLPVGFFDFDLKDTMRLVVWLVMGGFAAGAFYNQRAADLLRLDSNTALLQERHSLFAKQHEREMSAVNSKLSDVDVAIKLRAHSDAVLAASLDGIRTELRYVNEKIDVLRLDARRRAGSE